MDRPLQDGQLPDDSRVPAPVGNASARILDSRLTARVRALAMDGVEDGSMMEIIRLSPQAMATALAQVLSAEDREILRNATWIQGIAHLLPESFDLVTYRDVQQARIAVRVKQTISQVDAVTSLRQKLLQSAHSMLSMGTVTRWGDVIQGLRVIGVPQVAAVTASPGHASIHRAASPGRTDIPEYIFNEDGEFVRNPAHAAAQLAANQSMNVGIGSLQINLADLRSANASNNPQDSTAVVLNPNNEIIGVTSGVSDQPLTNMKVADLRRLANPSVASEEEDAQEVVLQQRLSDSINTASIAELEEAFSKAIG